MLKIAVWNLKGGTGKSCTAQNLGAELAAAGLKTALIDLDGQRTLSYGFGMDETQPTVLDWLDGTGMPLGTGTSRLQLVPGDIGIFSIFTEDDTELMGKALARLSSFDLVFMDCPPSLSPPSIQAVLNADRVLIPTLCEPASLKGITEAVQFVQEERQQLPVDVVRTRYKPRLVLSRDANARLTEWSQVWGFNLLSAAIPENVAIAEAVAEQVPVGEYEATAVGAVAYRELASEVIELWQLKA